jgi:branched-chain amino acid transport system permease protein
MDIFIQQIINGLVLGSMYALIALGYTMVYGVLNLINFAHGDILMVGAMVGLSILKLVQQVAPDLPGIVKLIIAIVGAIPVCDRELADRTHRLPSAAQCAAPGAADHRHRRVDPAADLRHDDLGPQPAAVPADHAVDPVNIAGALISPTQIMLLILALAAMIGLVLIVEKTKMGRAMRATAENPRIAGLMGVDANRVIIVTFAIGAALAAIAGVMWAANYSTAQFAMGFVPGLKAFSAAVLGGIGNIYGAMLGGILLGLIESLGAGYIGDLTGNFLGSNYQDIFAFIVLIIVLTLRPSGIMGERVADRA